MVLTGDIACAEKLLQPARRVLKTGKPIWREPIEHRIAFWNEIRTNYDHYMREECGTFLEDVDLHIRSQFDAALVALVAGFLENHEDFPQILNNSEIEIRIWLQIERFSIIEILSEDDLRNRILKRETDLFGLLKDYYLIMNRDVITTLDNPDIRLTLRYYLKRRWNGYRGKMDSAIADAVMKFDWMQELVAEWDKNPGERVT